MTKRQSFQHGFAAIAAVFLVVMLAAMGAFMVTFSNTQQLTSAQDLQGSKAYWAARAGLEWGIATSGTVASATAADCSAAPSTLTIDGFTVEIRCPRSSYVDGDNLNVFQVTAVAKSGTAGSVGYIERSVSASVCRSSVVPYGYC